MKTKITAVASAALLGAALTVGGAAPAHAATQLGGVNFNAWCATIGSVWYATNISLTTPYGWRCTNNYTHILLSIDVNRVCSRTYGAGAYAGLVSYSPYGWKCYR